MTLSLDCRIFITKWSIHTWDRTCQLVCLLVCLCRSTVTISIVLLANESNSFHWWLPSIYYVCLVRTHACSYQVAFVAGMLFVVTVANYLIMGPLIQCRHWALQTGHIVSLLVTCSILITCCISHTMLSKIVEGLTCWSD